MSKDKEKKSASRTPFLLVSAILFIVLGIVVIMFKSQITDMLDDIIKWVAAGILGIIAAINLVTFAKNTKENIKQLIIGALALIAAIILLISHLLGVPNLLIMVVGFMFGLYLIVEGFFKLKTAFASKKNENNAWYVPLIFGIVSILLGVLIIFFGISVTKLFVIAFGILLIYAGIQNVVNLFFGNKN
ncbi:MAG: DUF308 domain-containing protein [Lachnospiraceae bacterium]|nr:DUF308 domain-containing protein [Lachnospiraceae bacterium]